MRREGGEEQKPRNAKAKLDSKGRPIVVKPEDRKDDASPVKVAVRLGCLLLIVSTKTGCAADAPVQPAVDPRIELAVAEAQEAAARAVESSLLSAEAWKAAKGTEARCAELAKAR